MSSLYQSVMVNNLQQLVDANVFSVNADENRHVYLQSINESVSNIFKLGDVPKITPAPENWKIFVGDEEVNVDGNFLAIGTTRGLGDRNNKAFYQFKQPVNSEFADISRVHCILYFYRDFVAVVDLWSYHGTDVIIDGKVISSVKKMRKIIKILDNGYVVLKNCYSAKKIKVQRRKEEKKVVVQEKKECVVCMDDEPTHVIIPCGHKCLCEGCSKKIVGDNIKCPICREPVTNIIKVFVL